MSDKTQWSTIKPYLDPGYNAMTWIPEEDRIRVAAYMRYDDMYWNDPRQYALRILDDEQPIYIPNPRIIIDTTAYYLLKELKLVAEDKNTSQALEQFLKREVFYSRFHAAKQAGVARGDFVFHLTANPNKPEGSRISLNSVEPTNVFPIWDEDDPDRMVGCHLATPYLLSKEEDPEQKMRLRRLTYRIDDSSGTRRISREEAIFEVENLWYGGGKAKRIKTILPLGYLDERITAIPVYWFKNRHWDGEAFGSSELRGIERLGEVVSQGTTDVAASLSLEGLGVYATDGGRPVVDDGSGNYSETEWEVSPGKVMEVPQGSYFRRVEGVGSITPAVDQIKYLESKMNEAAGLSDVALGKVEAQVAKSGIALAIKFLPTLAKIETRDQTGKDILTQLFYDWKTWYQVFEHQTLQGDIVPTIGDKLPTDRVARLNELNNMRDRKIITATYYRTEMEKLGYEFPANMEQDLLKEAEAQARIANLFNQSSPSSNNDETSQPASGNTLPSGNSGSNNKSRPNESSGTEAQQTRDA